MIKIESKENSIFKEAKNLKNRKERKKTGKFLVEGFRFLSEAFKSTCSVDIIFLAENEIEKFNIYFNKEELKNTKVFLLDSKLLQMLCNTEAPQGVVGVVNVKISEIKKDGFYVLCDQVQDPGNLGTIIRTSHAAGASGVIITKGTVDPYNDKTLRSTMGSIFHIPIIEDMNFEVINGLKNQGYDILASSLDTDKNFFQEDITNNLVICVGNEGNGISDYIYSLSNKLVKIPMPGGAESLNVSTAAAIMIYERIRQNMLKGIEF
ncbi:TrmH family RNA methyltransferase [Clostridium paridis]|uniref:RNA methyltransferase n=1 Tax=Clostridium paridis TaxID=2803863 RepID=A0A937K2X7_9CLOT|nr:RNA methyltransferase [Clostridium paridis]MBL4931077.1 RNA methyltransferase [Clostridium paridis]